MGFPRFNPEEADLFIAMKRAQALGFVENPEPLAKRLKYEEVDMDVENTNDAGKIEIPTCHPKPSAKSSSDEAASGKSDDAASKKSDSETTNSETESEKETTAKKSDKDGKTKEIDETTYRHWYLGKPLSSGGITYVMYTPPPMPRTIVGLCDLPKNACVELDREPWKTASTSWYDPLYGDLAAPTGTYDAIRTLLKDKVVKRKPMAV